MHFCYGNLLVEYICMTLTETIKKQCELKTKQQMVSCRCEF